MEQREAPVIHPETALERAIVGDPTWCVGIQWGDPRPGHPEGAVAFHIVEVLANVDKAAYGDWDRTWLRFVSLVHDTFKYQVDRSKARVGHNHHGWLARRFAEGYTWDERVLEIIELHDEAFLAWKAGDRSGNWDKAEKRARRLIKRLEDLSNVGDYLRFYRADNATGDKQQDCVRWFEGLL